MLKTLRWILILNLVYFTIINCLNEPISHEYCIVGAGAAGIQIRRFI